MNKQLVAYLLIACLLLTACEQYATYTPSAADLTALAEQYHGDDKEMIQQTAIARYLTAEAAQAAQELAAAQIAALEATRAAAATSEYRQYIAMTTEAQSTRDALSAEATRQAVSAIATAQALDVQATQRATNATATAEIVHVTAQALAIQATATVEARNWQATLTAESLARDATATAQHKADLATATQQAKNDRATATQESVDATAGAVHATMTRQAENREAVLGYGRDYGIPVVLFVIAGGLLWLAWYLLQEYKKRPIIYERNFLGDAQPMAVPVDDGGYNLVDLDRQPGPVLKVLPNGEVTAPVLRTPAQEERTTARDQMVDAATRPRIGPGHRGTSAALPSPPQAPAPGLRSVRILRRLDQAQAVGLLPPPLVESLQTDWEE